MTPRWAPFFSPSIDGGTDAWFVVNGDADHDTYFETEAEAQACADKLNGVDFTCECPLDPGEPRRLYQVTGHDGDVVLCSYCDDCAQLARDDWTGETASCKQLP